MTKKIATLFIGVLLTIGFGCKKSGSGDGTVVPPVVNTTEGGLVTVSPNFPTDNEDVTITFDATKGNAGLANYSGDIYMHTGVVTDQSAGEWKYVKVASFSSANAIVKMTALGSKKYKITLNPRTYYGVPNGEKILKIAMVFRSGDGAVSGRNSDGSDVFTPIYETEPLQVKFLSPELEPMFEPKPVISVQAVGGQVSVKAVSNRSANLTLSLNNQSFATASNVSTISGTATITANGIQTIKIAAVEGGNTAEQTIEFIVNGTPVIGALPGSVTKDGVNIINNGTSAIFNIYAPGKSSVYLIGDFNNWQLSNAYAMKRTSDGNRWWIQIDNLNPQTEYAYQYYVDGSLKIADPYTEKILDPANDSYISSVVYPNLKAYPSGKTTGIVSTFQPIPDTYSWQVADFSNSRPDKTNLVVYELHIRDFVSEHSYNAALQKLDYLKTLGINAIELMPVNEFEGNNSWGYNPSFYFAPDKYYGTKQALQGFIDACHEKGMAVILDMVLNHSFGQSPMVQLYFNKTANRPASNNPWFNMIDQHPYSVGYDFNHENAVTKQFSKNVMKFWLEEYKVDGFRFDLSKGFTQKYTGTDVAAWGNYDASRIAIWKDYNAYIKSVDPSSYVILEHFAADAEEKELAEDGMMLWNNVNYNFSQASKGLYANGDFKRSFFDQHSGFTSASQNKLMTYMESHDEQRLMYENLNNGSSSGSYNIKTLATALKRQEMANAFFLTIPGPKMIWQFGELGYDYSIDFNGRLGEKPIKWDYNTGIRKDLYTAIAKMIDLKLNPSFNFTSISYNLSSAVKYIKLTGANLSVVVVGNFDVVSKDASVTFPSNGTWYDYMSPGSTEVISGTYIKTLAPGEYHIYTSVNLN